MSTTDLAKRLSGRLTAGAVDWLLQRGAAASPRARPEERALRARLAAEGVEWSPVWGDFDRAFGGVAVPSEEGERHVFGIAEMLERGFRCRGGRSVGTASPSGAHSVGTASPSGARVPIGTFDGGEYQMDAGGRVWVEDQVVTPFVVADDWVRLVERFAVGQEYPRAFFPWPGSFAVETTERVAAELAEALGAGRVPRWSDSCQAVYQEGSLGIWAPPEFAEMSAAGCVAIAADAASVRRVIEALAARCPGTGTSIGVGGGVAVTDEVVDALPELPASSEGLRFERWMAPAARGALVLDGSGGVEQWSVAPNGIQVDLIRPSGISRVRKMARKSP